MAKPRRKSTKPIPAAKPAKPRWVRWLMGTAAAIAIAIVPLVFLEAGLRIADFGYPTGFFISLEGRAAATSNERFGWRFFPPSISRAPVISRIAIPKPAGTYRIFILGDSAAMGIPEPAFGFGKMLRVLLEDRYPGATFEIVNTAMTAINSNVELPIAQDCARLQPDLFIVVTGNNEVVGPYGPGTVLARYSSSRSLIRAGIAFRATRTAELMERWLARPADAPTEWGGMGMFEGHEVSHDDPRLASVYSHFRANLEDIAAVARGAGASVVMATIPVNLRGHAPFVSLHSPALNPERKTQWQRLFDTAVMQAGASNFAAAESSFAEAEKLDPSWADEHYRRGECLYALNRPAEAAREFSEARDLDALRFRADSQINQTIRDVATKSHTPLIDAAQSFSNLAGNDLFYEHVHLTFEGNYRLATAMLPAVEAALPDAIRTRRTAAPAASETAVAHALAFTEWDQDRSRMQMLAMMLQPPFTGQSGFADRKETETRQLADLNAKWSSPERLAGVPAQLTVYASALARHPDDIDLRELAAEMQSRAGDSRAAISQYRALLNLVPGVARWHGNLAHELLATGDASSARDEASEALRLDPQLVAAQYTMGEIQEAEKQPDAAAEWYESVLRLQPSNAAAHLRLAIIHTHANRYREAADQYTAYLRYAPGSAEAESNLGFLLVKLGDVSAAIPHYREALRLRPAFPEAANNLGGALERLGQKDEAIDYYRMALRLRPDFPQARERLNQALNQSPRK